MISPPYREPDMPGFEATSNDEAHFSHIYLIVKLWRIEIKATHSQGSLPNGCDLYKKQAGLGFTSGPLLIMK